MIIILFFYTKSKTNESNMGENNAYFDTSPAMAPKSDEFQYCNKNVATPKATKFNYQLGIHTNLRGIGIICVAYKVSFL